MPVSLSNTDTATRISEERSGLLKILAQNHQVLGVNKAIPAMLEARAAGHGRGGVFWHTQGAGKSLSMVFFAQKILRHIEGNWTFVIVTDRVELDDQIAKTFKATGAVSQQESQVCHAGSGAELRDLLRGNHRYVFTLIQKFQTPEMLCEAGLRCGEMMALEWRDVDFRKRQLTVQRSDWKGHVTAPKSGRLRYIPLTVRLEAALRDHRHLKGLRVLSSDDGNPLTQRDVQGLVRRAAQRAKLDNIGVHVLRHTFCSHVAMRGAPTRAIQELAGHGEMVTTQRYMHLSPAAIDSAIRLLDQRGNIVATPAATVENINR